MLTTDAPPPRGPFVPASQLAARRRAGGTAAPPRAPGAGPAVTAARIGVREAAPLPAGVLPPPVPVRAPSEPVISEELQAAISTEVRRLHALRAEHMAELQRIDSALARLESVTAAPQGRPRGSTSARDATGTRAMLERYAAEAWDPASGPITADKAIPWMLANGWVTSAVNRRGTVKSTLTHLPSIDPRWRRVKPGQYVVDAEPAS